jgi:hypothetical protein
MARMATFSIEHLRRTAAIAALAVCAGGLAGCMVPERTLSSDFGRALHENLVAQVADPDVAYGPPPPSNGGRAGLAMERYRTGKVIKPVPAAASKLGAILGAEGSQ